LLQVAVFSVYQHWDPLKVCVVGSTYPPEFYDWITVPRVRSLFEKIAEETVEDLDNLAKLLQRFGVKVLRPDLPRIRQDSTGRYLRPPQTPRDFVGMIGQTFYYNFGYFPAWQPVEHDVVAFYHNIKEPSWPDINNISQICKLSPLVRSKLEFRWQTYRGNASESGCFDNIIEQIRQQGNLIRAGIDRRFNTAMIYRIGRDLFHGTMDQVSKHPHTLQRWQKVIDREFPDYRNHIVDTQGHSDGMYCPVCPGLVISLDNLPTTPQHFPGWEVVWLPHQGHGMASSFQKLKLHSQGKWWIPGWENDSELIDVVERCLSHWTGNIAETIFDVNMLIIDSKNVIVMNHSEQVFRALDRYGITPHVAPLRHRYFWDGGIHCVTADLHREGAMRDYFPHR
jgi:hypothetical protein